MSTSSTSLESSTSQFESADGTLVIMIVRARHLPNRRKLDKQSPYVVIRLGTHAKKTNSDFRAGQTPEWTHEVRFELSRDKRPVLKVDLLDETNGDPTPIGGCEIDASIVLRHPDASAGKYIYDKWYDLTYMGKRAGMLYLEMTFYPSAPVLPPKLLLASSSYPVTAAAAADGEIIMGIPNVYADDDLAINTNPSSSKGAVSPYRRNAIQDVFVSSDDSAAGEPQSRANASHVVFVSSDSSQSSKKSSIFSKTNQLFQTPANGGFASLNRDDSKNDVVISVTGAGGDGRKSPSKLAAKFARFKDKLGNKQWSDAQHLSAYGNGIKRDISPISAYQSNDLDELEDEFRRNERYNDQVPDLGENIVFKSPHKAETQAPVPSPTPPPPPQHQSYPTTTTSSANHSPTLNKPLPAAPIRKAPPSMTSKLDLKDSTAIPFSAESIGADNFNEALPTKVYMLDEQVKSLSFKESPSSPHHHLEPDESLIKDEIDPQYYAPTPSEHFSKPSNRFANGGLKRENVKVDLRTERTGYMGDGKFSPSIFQKASTPIPTHRPWNVYREKYGGESYIDDDDDDDEEEDKPPVPPKIPRGMNEFEYFALEKDKFMSDLQGNRI
ncbi:uncharacterized protein LODBEIA_P09940 [Lodderomyces beijingensis]|uniref:C2 domain-containing protein n=1 Tax=Lodderomyces beijingensis TaxID=1775926 RepID=A0ABP0ZHZ3_9ASCO